MKRLIDIICLFVLFTLACESKIDFSDPEIIRVNQQAIPQSRFHNLMRTLVTQGKFEPTGNDKKDFEDLKKLALDKIIERELVLEQANQSGTQINEAVVDNQMVQYVKQFKNDREFWEALDAANLDEDKLRQQFYDNLLINDFLDQKFKPIYDNIPKEITEEEIQEYYNRPKKFLTAEQVKLRQIFFKMPATTPFTEKAEIRVNAEKVLQQAKAGKNFARLAKAFSQDTRSAPKGGDLGFVGPRRFEPEFEEAAFALQKGEISDLVQTKDGLYIIELEERQLPRKVEFHKIRGLVTNFVIKERKEQKFQDYVAELRKDAVIVVADSLKPLLKMHANEIER